MVSQRIVALIAALSVSFALTAPCFATEILIEVSPRTLNLQSEGEVVTVHTDIGYSLVDVATVYLNDVALKSWKVDNQGNFVAKFLMDEIKSLDGLVVGDYNTLKLVGLTVTEDSFWGEAEIMVIDIEAEGPGRNR